LSYFLSSQPLWITILLLVAVPTTIAMGAQTLIHRLVGAEKLVQNNEIAGFKFATVGVIYAVLLAFAVIVVWEQVIDGNILMSLRFPLRHFRSLMIASGWFRLTWLR
jgi:hypothetical protein